MRIEQILAAKYQFEQQGGQLAFTADGLLEITWKGRKVMLEEHMYFWRRPDGTARIFDTERAYTLILAKLPPIQIINLVPMGGPEEFLKRYRDLDTRYAITTDLLRPVLAVHFEGADAIIDGNHRTYKALALRQTGIYGWVLAEPRDVAAITVAELDAEFAGELLKLGF